MKIDEWHYLENPFSKLSQKHLINSNILCLKKNVIYLVRKLCNIWFNSTIEDDELSILK